MEIINRIENSFKRSFSTKIHDQISTTGKVPVLETPEGTIVCESEDIMNFLIEKYSIKEKIIIKKSSTNFVDLFMSEVVPNWYKMVYFKVIIISPNVSQSHSIHNFRKKMATQALLRL